MRGPFFNSTSRTQTSPVKQDQGFSFPQPLAEAPLFKSPWTNEKLLNPELQTVAVHETGYRRGAVDLRASGAVKSDWWHQGQKHVIVNPNSTRGFAIYFNPESSSGSNTGVAMTELEYEEGTLCQSTPIQRFLPEHLKGRESVSFIISWPGYHSVKAKLRLRHGSDHKDYTLGEIAAQIAKMYRAFIKEPGHFNPRLPHAIRLGARNVNLSHLRLISIYPISGSESCWHAEISFIPVDD